MEDFLIKNLEWHYRWLGLADHVSTFSKDPSTQCGCYIVDKDNNDVGFGYNGFPRGMKDTAERYLDRDFKYKHILHSEMAALLSCPFVPEGSYAYITHPPCVRCLGALRQKRIFNVVAYAPSEDFASRWDQEECMELADELGISVKLLPKEIHFSLTS